MQLFNIHFRTTLKNNRQNLKEWIAICSVTSVRIQPNKPNLLDIVTNKSTTPTWFELYIISIAYCHLSRLEEDCLLCSRGWNTSTAQHHCQDCRWYSYCCSQAGTQPDEGPCVYLYIRTYLYTHLYEGLLWTPYRHKPQLARKSSAEMAGRSKQQKRRNTGSVKVRDGSVKGNVKVETQI